VVRADDATQLEDHAQASEERILQATMAALAALDPAALAIKQICQAAQVTAPTIYYHYGNKDGLIAAAVERLVADWLAAMDAAVDRRAPLEAAIAQAMSVWTEAITSPSRPLAVFTWATLLLSESADLPRGALIEARDRGRAMIADVATQYIGPGPGVDVIAQLVTDSVIATAVQYELDHDRQALQTRLDALALAVRTIATGT
jgi:AcrR family transcriptional regulator